jgi:hypothetical protein
MVCRIHRFGEDSKGKEELKGKRWSLFLSPVKPGDQGERKVRAPQGRVVRNPDCPGILKHRISR